MAKDNYNPTTGMYKRVSARFKSDTPFLFACRVVHSIILRYERLRRALLANYYRIVNGDRFLLRDVLGSKMYLDLKDKGLARDILAYGIRERYSVDVMKEELKPGQVVVDIGANIGYYALLEAKIIGERGRVYCLEPAPENIDLLRRNVAVNGYTNIEIYHAAAGAESKMGTIYLSESHNQHALIAENVGGMIGSMPVQVFALDDFLKDKPYPSIVRMDVEGFELDILRGMKKILAEKNPLKFYIEIHGFFLKDGGVKELLSILKGAGFRVKVAVWDPMEIGGNFIRPLYYYCSRKLGIGNKGLFYPSMDELEKVFVEHGEITLAAFFERA